MEILNDISTFINRLIKQCEDSKLVSFAYQDTQFSIEFSKTDFKPVQNTNVTRKSSTDSIFETKEDNIGDVFEEYASSDNSVIDKSNKEEIITIISPYVGTVELSNNIKLKGKEIYVNKGDVLCSVEAMKIFNDIKAPVSGMIVEILIEDCSLVEYEQPILKIREESYE